MRFQHGIRIWMGRWGWLSLLVWAGCGGFRIEDLAYSPKKWGFQGDGGLAGRYISASDAEPPFEPVWQYNMMAGLAEEPFTVHGRYLFVANLRGEIHVLDAETGQKIGYAAIGEALIGTPVVWHDLILVCNGNGKTGVSAYRYTQGQKAWTRKGSACETGLWVEHERVFYGGTDGELHAIRIADGVEEWAIDWADPDERPVGTPVSDGERLYLATETGRVLAISQDRGTIVWQVQTKLPVWQTLVVWKQQVFVPTMRGVLLALNAETGTENWRMDAKNEWLRLTTPAVREQSLILGASNGQIWRIRVADGAVEWTEKNDGAFLAPPLWAEKNVWFAGLDQNLRQINAETGAEIHRIALKGRAKSVPLVVQNRILVGMEPTWIVAYGNRSTAKK